MKKKLLILCPRFPYPVIGGDRLRIFEICKSLSLEYELTLLSFCETRHELHYAIPDDGVFNRVERIYLPRWRSYLNVIFALSGKTPLQVAYYQSAEFKHRFDALLPDHDLVLAHLIRTATYAKNAGVPKILEMTDAISMNYERVMKAQQISRNIRTWDIRAFIYTLELLRLKRFERVIPTFFDASILVSKVDRDYLFAGEPKLKSKSMVCSNGVDTKLLPFNFANQSVRIVFIGNMFSLQNKDAALYFAQKILPLIRNEMPSAYLDVVGRINQADAAALKKIAGVRVTGEVKNIAEAVRGAAVGVCPIRLGAGVQNKILEYMALGLPVVTSSVGLEGIAASDQKELFVADEPADHAQKVLLLLSDRELARQMALTAREYVQTHHSWVEKMRPLRTKVSELLNNHTKLVNEEDEDLTAKTIQST